MTDGLTPNGSRPVDELYARAYDELRRLAAAVRRGDPFATITTRSLVHETWFKFSGSATPRFEDEKHLVQIVVRAMRQVLVDAARYRRAGRRTGIEIPVDESIGLPAPSADQTIVIHDALSRLHALDAELADIVELRYYGGFSLAEIAAQRGVSESKIRRDFQTALSWLKASMEEGA